MIMTATTSLILVGVALASWSSPSFTNDSGPRTYAADRNEDVAGIHAQDCARYSDWTPTRAVESCDPMVQAQRAPKGKRMAATQGQPSKRHAGQEHPRRPPDFTLIVAKRYQLRLCTNLQLPDDSVTRAGCLFETLAVQNSDVATAVIN